MPRKISHDKVFKTLFQLHLQDLVELLERDIGPHLDCSRVRYPSGEAFAELKKAGHLNPDLVAHVPRRDAGIPVLLHAEIESRFRGDMVSRMWKYFTHLSAQNLDAMVIPLVVYLKGGPPGLREHVTANRLGSFVPVAFRHLSLGLSGCLAEEWLEKPQMLAAALAACMRSKTWDRVEHKLQCMRRVMHETNPERQYLLAQVVENYLKLTDEEDARYRAALVREEKTMVPFPLTFQEALAENEARGEKRGKLEGIRESILLLLDSRFGAIPSSLRDKLAAVSEQARLKQIFVRAAQAPSVAELEAALG